MKWLWLFPSGALALPAWAQDWKVDYGKSEIRFVIKQMNVPVEGGFKRFNVHGRLRCRQTRAWGSSGWRWMWRASTRAPRRVTARPPGRPWPLHHARGNDRQGQDPAPGGPPGPGAPQRDGGWLASGRFALKRSDFDIGGGEWSDPSVVANEVDGRFNMTC
jgi:hypothetical protein